jgi:hypothetical protein
VDTPQIIDKDYTNTGKHRGKRVDDTPLVPDGVQDANSEKLFQKS